MGIKGDLAYSEIVYYLVLQGFPTTITLTLRDATALRAFPYHKFHLDYMIFKKLNLSEAEKI